MKCFVIFVTTKYYKMSPLNSLGGILSLKKFRGI